MGMFDWVHCEYKLPRHAKKVKVWQTKDTPKQSLENYTIKSDGTLWFDNDGLEERLETFTGNIAFCSIARKGRWVEFSASFVNGVLQDMKDLSE